MELPYEKKPAFQKSKGRVTSFNVYILAFACSFVYDLSNFFGILSLNPVPFVLLGGQAYIYALPVLKFGHFY